MTDLPQFQEIEDAWKAPAKIIEGLPASTERTSAERCLEQSRKYTVEARERAKLREADE